jgi:hypothetical protein
MLNHHLAGLLGLGSLSWAGHQIHVSLPVNKLLDAGVDPKEIPLPHEFLLNRAIMQDLYPSFAKGLAPFFTLQWGEYSDFLTFNGGSVFLAPWRFCSPCLFYQHGENQKNLVTPYHLPQKFKKKVFLMALLQQNADICVDVVESTRLCTRFSTIPPGPRTAWTLSRRMT